MGEREQATSSYNWRIRVSDRPNRKLPSFLILHVPCMHTTRSPLALRFGFGRSISRYTCNYVLPAGSKPTFDRQALVRRRRRLPCVDNVPAIITPSRVPSKRRSVCLGVVLLSNIVLGTDILLKPSRKLSRHCSIQPCKFYLRCPLSM